MVASDANRRNVSILTPNIRSPCIKFKVENKGQYAEYLQELEPIREELGIPLKEALYPDEK
ncbi:Cytochrome c oxidase protein [Pyrenophora tritici-repentis]|nr:Cytochrome c oxidase protein [Pyrenophora tritici-repentis]